MSGAPYSQAIIAAGLVFVSGQVPVDPATGKLVEGGIAEHTHRCFDNVAAILAEAGSGLDKLVKTTVFLHDIGDFAAMNAVYAERVPAPFPGAGRGRDLGAAHPGRARRDRSRGAGLA